MEATSPYCFDIDKKTGKQLCCPPGNDGNGGDSDGKYFCEDRHSVITELENRTEKDRSDNQ